MAKKKKTLAQQYEAQLNRIEKRLIEMQKRGYTVVGEFQHTVPKKVTKKMVDDLKAITPKSLAKLSDKSYTIDIGTKKQLVQKVKQAKKTDYRKKPVSARPPKPLPPRKPRPENAPPIDESEMILRRIKQILETSYDTGLNIPPWRYYQNISDMKELLAQTISQVGEKEVIHRFATAGEVAVSAVEGYVFSSDGDAAHMMSWYTFVDILTVGNIPEEINEMISNMTDWRESV